MEVRAFLHLLTRHWRLIVACLLVSVAAAAVVTWQTPPRYSASARLFVSTRLQDNTQAYEGSLFSEQRVASYTRLATDPALMARVIERLHLGSTPGALSQSISAEVLPETVILQITAQDSQAAHAERLARTTAAELSDYIQELETPTGASTSPIKATLLSASPAVLTAPKPVRNLTLAALVGLLAGVVAAVLRELLETTLRNGEDVGEVTTVAVMGNIGFDSTAARRPLLTSLDPRSPRSEAFRILRTNLQFVEVDKESRVFVVTSPVPGEGKTTTAINLAISFAQTGQKVLLLDGDLRSARVADYLGLSSEVGLTTALVGSTSFLEAIQYCTEPHLAVLTSGELPPNPAELLQTDAMHDVLRQARKEFDMVIVDGPPLLSVTDAALLARESDGALVVIRHGRTTKEQLRHALGRLDVVDARAVGIVINMVPRSGGQNSYGIDYGYPEARRSTSRH